MIFAKNDTNFILGNTRFTRCAISFRKHAALPTNLKGLTLSQLVNPSFTIVKGNVVCFCDGVKQPVKQLECIIPKSSDTIEDTCKDIVNTHECIELEAEFKNIGIVEIGDIKEERDNKYQAEKKVWVNHNRMQNERLTNAIDHGYDCDGQYCLEKISQDLPGFFMVDDTTFFYKSWYPTTTALSIEDYVKQKLSGSKSKYGTRVKICLLEQHNHIHYNDAEAVVVFNYLGKFDIIGIVDKIAKDMYERE